MGTRNIGRRAYACANAAVTFFDMLAACWKGPGSFHRHSYSSTMAGSGVEFSVGEGGGGLGSGVWMRHIFWLKSLAIISWGLG